MQLCFQAEGWGEGFWLYSWKITTLNASLHALAKVCRVLTVSGVTATNTVCMICEVRTRKSCFLRRKLWYFLPQIWLESSSILSIIWRYFILHAFSSPMNFLRYKKVKRFNCKALRDEVLFQKPLRSPISCYLFPCVRSKVWVLSREMWNASLAHLSCTESMRTQTSLLPILSALTSGDMIIHCCLFHHLSSLRTARLLAGLFNSDLWHSASCEVVAKEVAAKQRERRREELKSVHQLFIYCPSCMLFPRPDNLLTLHRQHCHRLQLLTPIAGSNTIFQEMSLVDLCPCFNTTIVLKSNTNRWIAYERMWRREHEICYYEIAS